MQAAFTLRKGNAGGQGETREQQAEHIFHIPDPAAAIRLHTDTAHLS